MTVTSLSSRSKKGARTRAKMRGFREKCATEGCFNSRDCAQPKCKSCRSADNLKKKTAVVRREQESLMAKAGLSGFSDPPFPLPMIAGGNR